LGVSVEHLLDTFSSRELTEWMIFYETEPFGFEVEMLGFAIVASTIVNVMRKKGTKVAKPEDFIPKSKERGLKETLGFVSAINEGLGG